MLTRPPAPQQVNPTDGRSSTRQYTRAKANIYLHMETRGLRSCGGHESALALPISIGGGELLASWSPSQPTSSRDHASFEENSLAQTKQKLGSPRLGSGFLKRKGGKRLERRRINRRSVRRASSSSPFIILRQSVTAINATAHAHWESPWIRRRNHQGEARRFSDCSRGSR